MDTLTRRRFLIASGVVGAAGLAAGSGIVGLEHLHAQAAVNPLPSDAHVLLLVTLYGGNDGLNTVIPYADPAYHDARPELAYPAEQVLHLDSSLGLNPALKGLAQLWRQKRLAVVRGVGYPNPDHSHFRSMDIWQTASPDAPVNTGWIGRWLDSTGDDPVRAVNVGAVLPPLAVGSRCTAAAIGAGRPERASACFAGLGQPDAVDGPAAAMVCASYRAERTTASTFASISAAGQSLKSQLDTVAACVKAGVPTRVYTVSLGGFDTHANEKGTQQAQLAALDGALSGFLNEMAGDPHGRKVVAVVYSEFGRRVHANASQGTDHGTAGPVLVAGVPVRGGFYGEQPSLTVLDNGDLKAAVDFRAIYAEVLAGVLGTDPAKVLGQDRPRLGFL